MFSVDLHAHTRFFHGFAASPTPFDPVGAKLLARWADCRDLDGVALTNHDYYADFETVAQTAFVPGIEISTTDGHALVVGPDPPSRTEPGELTPREAVSLAHERDCAAVVPHPFRAGRVAESGAAFDAVEINGKHPAHVDRVRELSERLDLPMVGGSDAHFPFEVGRAYTRIDASRLTPAAVAAAIRDGRVQARVRTSAVDEALRTAYRYVHRYRR